MKLLRRLYLRIFPKYLRLELRGVSWSEADRLIRESDGKPEGARWVIAKEEDHNLTLGVVWLERRRRITG